MHPCNAEGIVAAARASVPDAATLETRGRTADGRGYTRSTVAAPDGTARIELWMVDGAGHAWSGGSPAGSYTDPHGPEASAEMLRFFLSEAGEAPA